MKTTKKLSLTDIEKIMNDSATKRELVSAYALLKEEINRIKVFLVLISTYIIVGIAFYLLK